MLLRRLFCLCLIPCFEKAGLPLLTGALLRGGHIGELLFVAEAAFECLGFDAVNLSREIGNLAVQIHHGIPAIIAARDVVAFFFERLDEGRAVVAGVPGFEISRWRCGC